MLKNIRKARSHSTKRNDLSGLAWLAGHHMLAPYASSWNKRQKLPFLWLSQAVAFGGLFLIVDRSRPKSTEIDNTRFNRHFRASQTMHTDCNLASPPPRPSLLGEGAGGVRANSRDLFRSIEPDLLSVEPASAAAGSRWKQRTWLASLPHVASTASEKVCSTTI